MYTDMPDNMGDHGWYTGAYNQIRARSRHSVYQLVRIIVLKST